MATVAELQAQLATAKQARDSGQINQAQYNEFAAKQAALISEARANEQRKALNIVQNPQTVTATTPEGTTTYAVSSETKTQQVTPNPLELTKLAQEVIAVNKAPTTNEEAIAKGKDSYIPQETKEEFYRKAADYLIQTEQVKTTTYTPTSFTPAERQFEPSNNSFFGVKSFVLVDGVPVEVSPDFFTATPAEQRREISIVTPQVKAEKQLPSYERSMSGAESRAISGLTLGTVVATGIALPFAGVSGLIVTSVAEGVKYGITREHLTVDEALTVASLGQLASIGAMAVVRSPKVSGQAQAKLTESYEKHAMNVESYMEATNYPAGEKLTAYALEHGEPLPGVWRPTTSQRIIMKVTGATPSKPASGVVSFGGPVEMFDAKTGKMGVAGGLNLRQLEAVGGAFDMTVAPGTSGLMISRPYLTPKPNLPQRLPTYFGIGESIFSLNEAKAEPLTQNIDLPEKGLPESFLDYDYRGSMSFKRVSNLKETNVQGKTAFSKWPSKSEVSPKEVTYSAKTINPKTEFKEPKSTISQPANLGATQLELQKNVISGTGVKSTQFIYQGIRQNQKAKNPFSVYQGPSYYPQNVSEETEEVSIVLPSQVSRLDSRQVSMGRQDLTQRTVLGVTDLTKPSAINDMVQIQGEHTKQSILTVSKQTQESMVTPIQEPIVIPEIVNPYKPQFNQTQEQFTFPQLGGKAMESGFGFIGRGYPEGIGKRIRFFPVVDPEEVLGALL